MSYISNICTSRTAPHRKVHSVTADVLLV